MKALFKDNLGEFTVSKVKSIIADENIRQGKGYIITFEDGTEKFYTAELCAAEE